MDDTGPSGSVTGSGDERRDTRLYHAQQLTSATEKDKKHAKEGGIAAAVTKQTAARFS